MARRIAMVTGAGSGIATATAQRLVEAGHDVALFDLNGSAVESACGD
ncbi:SDR family NAD(P)-dependent oxidoreductase [Rhizobium sp. LEGMi198b]